MRSATSRPATASTQALAGVALDVKPGEIVVMLGANGAGKSTLLKSIAGLVRPQPGARVTFDGPDLLALPPHEIVEAGIALVPEGRGIFAELTVRENLELGAYARRARAGEAENLARVMTLFPRLAERGPQLARTMSGGEQQMVAIGRALMSAPKLLLLDEPSLGLSPLLCGELFQALARVREAGVGYPAGRAERRAGPEHRRPRLSDRDRPHRRAGERAVAAQRSGGAARISGNQARSARPRRRVSAEEKLFDRRTP